MRPNADESRRIRQHLGSKRRRVQAASRIVRALAEGKEARTEDLTALGGQSLLDAIVRISEVAAAEPGK